MKKEDTIQYSELKRDVAMTLGVPYKETDKVIDRFFELLTKEVFETGKEANILGYGNFYIYKGRKTSGDFTSKKRKSKRKSYSLRFRSSQTFKSKLKKKYGTKTYNLD